MKKSYRILVYFALILGCFAMFMEFVQIILALQNGGNITIYYNWFNEMWMEIIFIGFCSIYLFVILIGFYIYHWNEVLK